MNKKTYVLTISEYFPKGHSREGEPTDFVNAIASAKKIHTIRENYDLWSKRADKINKGLAVLSIRVWTGKPYNSKQREVFCLEGIGVEKLQFTLPFGWFINDVDTDYCSKDFARNDGLSIADFNSWFNRPHIFEDTMAIIHFSDFRYAKK